MPKTLGVYFKDSTLKKIDELAQKLNKNRSQVIEELINIGLDKKATQELKQETALMKLKNDIISDLENRFKQLETNISLEFAYKFDKLQDQITEMQQQIDTLQSQQNKQEIYSNELLWIMTYVRIMIANLLTKAFSNVFDDDLLQKMRDKATELTDDFKKTLQ